jgi:hypothetical protein
MKCGECVFRRSRTNISVEAEQGFSLEDEHAFRLKSNRCASVPKRLFDLPKRLFGFPESVFGQPKRAFTFPEIRSGESPPTRMQYECARSPCLAEPSRAGEKQMYVADPVASDERGDHVLVEAVCADMRCLQRRLADSSASPLRASVRRAVSKQWYPQSNSPGAVCRLIRCAL